MVTNTSLSASVGARLAVPAMSVALVAGLSASWLLAGHLVAGAPPMVVAAGRTVASFVVLTAIALLYPRPRSEIMVAARRGGSVVLLGFLSFFAYIGGTMVATLLIGASRVGLITSLLPSLTFVVGIIVFREPATRRKVLGTALGLLGACGYAILDTHANELPGMGPTVGALLGGVLLAFGGTLAYAVYGYVYPRRMTGLSSLGTLPAISGAGSVMLGLVVIAFVPFTGLSWDKWAGILALGAGLTAPIFLLFHELVLRKGPLFTTAVTLAVPFLIRIGEWALGWEDAPKPVVILLLFACVFGVWLTMSGGRLVARPLAKSRIE